MTKRQDLCLQRRSRPEQSDQRQANQPANISRQPGASPDSTSLTSRIEFPTMTAPLARGAAGTARGRGYQLRRGQRTQVALAPVSLLRRSHDHHRDIPTRSLAALPSCGIPRRDQGRHIMIRLDSRRHSRTELLLRRLSIGNGLARRRAALDNRLVNQSWLRDAGSACRDRPTGSVAPSIVSQTCDQCTSTTDRQRRNPHSV